MMECNQICKWNSNVGCVKPYGVPCILENVSPTDQKATNADRIRAMSDEELEKFICSCSKCEFCKFIGWAGCKLSKWLQQPVE